MKQNNRVMIHLETAVEINETRSPSTGAAQITEKNKYSYSLKAAMKTYTEKTKDSFSQINKLGWTSAIQATI